jgi:hypothetical protein
MFKAFDFHSSKYLSSLLSVFVLCISVAQATEKVPYWLEPRSNVIIDEQLSAEIGRRSGIFVLRAPFNGPSNYYSFKETVARLKRNAPGVPVLSYAWTSRYHKGGRIETYYLKDLDLGKPVAKGRKKGKQIHYLDMASQGLRQSLVQHLAAERLHLGLDGFALDGIHRTPTTRPVKLARICERNPGYCEVYAKGMDEFVGSLNAALGRDGTVVYNGLWDTTPGMLNDQLRLLPYADAAAVEFFGMRVKSGRKGFRHHILPFINIMRDLSMDKPLLVFGRGPWAYTDYVEDYHWQRYLYASFLLGRRAIDLFKYHSSFQVPASPKAGRSGGLDVYADWSAELGTPLAPYRRQGGLYQRHFSGGRVFVAPDDGAGGQVHIDGTMYSLEGNEVSGLVSLGPGEGLVLLDRRKSVFKKPVVHAISARTMAAWGWSGAKLKQSPAGEYLSLGLVKDKLVGEHDVLLDYERSLEPYRHLEIQARLLNRDSAISAVAEVDDPHQENAWLVVEFGPAQGQGGQGEITHMCKAVEFRAPAKKQGQAIWPCLSVKFSPDAEGKMLLDGEAVLRGTRYRFRRWSHLRIKGAVDVSGVVLSKPVRIH